MIKREAEKEAKRAARENKEASKLAEFPKALHDATELWKKLGKPGAAALWAAVKKEGIQITKKAVDTVAQSAARSVFRPAQPSLGKFTASDIGDQWQMDLAEMRKHKGTDKNFALCVVDVYSRKLWTKSLKDKKPDTVKRALSTIRDQAGHWPKSILSDKGAEFSGAVATWGSRHNVVMKTKDPADKNGLAVVDRAIQTLKMKLAERMSENEKGAWTKYLKEATSHINATPKPTVLHGAAPNEVQSDPMLQFMLGQDNARKLQHNMALRDKRAAAVEDKYFRTPVKNNFNRAYNPNYSSGVKYAIAVEGPKVIDNAGKGHPLKAVQPVPYNASDRVTPRFAQGRAHQVPDVAEVLKRMIREEGPMTMAVANKQLKTKAWGYLDRMRKAHMTLAKLVAESAAFKKVGNRIDLA